MAKCAKCGVNARRTTEINVRNNLFLFCNKCAPLVRKAMAAHATGPIQDEKPPQKIRERVPQGELFNRAEYFVTKDKDHA